MRVLESFNYIFATFQFKIIPEYFFIGVALISLLWLLHKRLGKK